eukprot:CAMPEP_0117436942 /NCGR_PEP_ID=MMETSP0759-20121206/1268_1 /TAXON_ID=63605 /ORGANISM="Percolomonas cosmopolitus, Strain WS" /LENGTH=47 /DNA_ID= /DNA_START= /DNA_END= /DNA_ORIENTATION=
MDDCMKSSMNIQTFSLSTETCDLEEDTDTEIEEEGKYIGREPFRSTD